MSKQVYFDCNATTPTLGAAAKTALKVMEDLFGNPSSTHLAGIRAKSRMEATRTLIGDILKVEPSTVTFTSGATEAIQMVIFSALSHFKESSSGEKRFALYGSTEHKAVAEALHHWNSILETGLEIKAIPVDHNGQLDHGFIRKYLSETVIICTMAVNNETGVIQNLQTLSKTLKESKTAPLWLVDSVQALGKIPLDLNSLGVDYACFSGHKLYAPKGIGFLYAKSGAPLKPLIVGGGQEKGLRSGTENLPGVAALGEALSHIFDSHTGKIKDHGHLHQFRKQITAALKKAFPQIVFNTPFDCSVPTTVNFSIPGFSSKELLDLFDAAGIRLSSGSACNSQKVEPSHVLCAMNLESWRTTSALRLSFGPATLEEEIQEGCKRIHQAALALEGSCLLNGAHEFEAPEHLRDGVIQLRVGPTNCWVVAHKDTRQIVIIDPFEQVAERIESFVRCQNLKILAILDTHSHTDHESVRPSLRSLLKSYFVHPNQQETPLGWPKNNLSIKCEDGKNYPYICFDSDSAKIVSIPTPGHTDDSHLYLFGRSDSKSFSKDTCEFAFCGDTVLCGGLGRTNFVSSNSRDLQKTLQLFTILLSENSFLCPAHDYTNGFATLFKTEEQTNPLLAAAIAGNDPASVETFLKEKAKLDDQLKALEANFQGIVCGVTPGCEKSSLFELSWPQVEKQLSRFEIIDVREPYEFKISDEWADLGLKPPRNVPLSRFVNLMHELKKSKPKDIVLICRSGNRSGMAAAALRRIGISHVWSVAGGLALMNQELPHLKASSP